MRIVPVVVGIKQLINMCLVVMIAEVSLRTCIEGIGGGVSRIRSLQVCGHVQCCRGRDKEMGIALAATTGEV